MENQDLNEAPETVETPEAEPQAADNPPVRNPDDWVTEHFSKKEMTRSDTAARRGWDNTPRVCHHLIFPYNIQS